MILKLAVPFTCDDAGAATVTTASFTGRLLAVHFIQPGSGGVSDASIAVTGVNTGESVLAVSGVSDGADWYPRGPVHDTSGAAVLYAAAGQPVTDQLAFAGDQLQFAVTGAGAGAEGEFIAIVDGEQP